MDKALAAAATLGIESLTIGSLATSLGMSKSGLMGHFRSKEQLQLQVLKEGVDRFIAQVVVPALQHRRGEPRVWAMFDNWIGWAASQPGGCVIYNASSELDDRPGPLRDFLQSAHCDWRGTIMRAAKIAIEEGHFRRNLDVEQFAFELSSLALAYHHAARLLDDGDARARARRAFVALIERARA